MILDFFRLLKKDSVKEIETNEFINELSQSLEKESERKSEFEQEDCLYYVVEENIDFVYLQNMNTDEIFKETNLSQDIKQNLMEGQMLRYKNGTYYIDEEETEKYENSLVDVKEYTKIKEEFMVNSGILGNDINTRYKVLSQNKEEGFTVLTYEMNGTKEIKVSNELLPYVVNDKKVFYYEDGKFKTDVEETKKNIYK